MPRIVANVKANNRYEAMAALDLLKEKIKHMPYGDPIEERVEVSNEGGCGEC